MIQAISRMRAGWDRYFFSSVGPVDLCVGRLVFFSLAFLYYVSQDFSEWGTVGAEFWMPTAFFSALHLRALSPEAITAVQSVWKISLALAAVGLWTRSAMLLSFAGSFYLLGLPHNFGQTQHFDTLVVIVCGVLATSRAGDAWSLDALRRAARLGNPALDSDLPSADYRWPVRAIWVTTALVFFAAGVSKLRHSGLTWIFSDHLAILLVRHQYFVSDGEPLTAWGPIIASYAWAARALAAVAVLTEVLYPLALFSTRARIVLVPAGVGFLVGIRLLMGPTFEPFVLCNMFWVPWEWVGHRLSVFVGTGTRYALVYDGACGMCRGTAGVLARTDLLGRLELVDVSGTRDLPSRFAGLTLEKCLDQMWLIAPDGKRYGGFEAYRRLSRLLPVLWPIAPVLRLPGARPLGSRAYAFIAARRGHAASSLRTQPEQR